MSTSVATMRARWGRVRRPRTAPAGLDDRCRWLVCRAAYAYGVAPEALRAANRGREVVAARHVAAALLRKEGLTLVDIGRALNQHHTTVHHGLMCADRDDARGRELRRRVEEVHAAYRRWLA